jgi:hypothetical protein
VGHGVYSLTGKQKKLYYYVWLLALRHRKHSLFICCVHEESYQLSRLLADSLFSHAKLSSLHTIISGNQSTTYKAALIHSNLLHFSLVLPPPSFHTSHSGTLPLWHCASTHSLRHRNEAAKIEIRRTYLHCCHGSYWLEVASPAV